MAENSNHQDSQMLSDEHGLLDHRENLSIGERVVGGQSPSLEDKAHDAVSNNEELLEEEVPQEPETGHRTQAELYAELMEGSVPEFPVPFPRRPRRNIWASFEQQAQEFERSSFLGVISSEQPTQSLAPSSLPGEPSSPTSSLRLTPTESEDGSRSPVSIQEGESEEIRFEKARPTESPSRQPVEGARLEEIVDPDDEVMPEELEQAAAIERRLLDLISDEPQPEPQPEPRPSFPLPVPRTSVVVYLTDFATWGDAQELGNICSGMYNVAGRMPRLVNSCQIFHTFDWQYRMMVLPYPLPPTQENRVVAFGADYQTQAMEGAESMAKAIAQIGGQVIVRLGWQMMNFPEGRALLTYLLNFWELGYIGRLDYLQGSFWPRLDEYHIHSMGV